MSPSSTWSSDATFILGLDVGTTSVKACLIDTATKSVAAIQAKDTQANVPSDCGTAGNEQDVPKIWSTIYNVVTRLPRELLRKVVYIGVCGQMHGIVFWKHGEGWERNGDKIELRVTSNLFTWQDNRCTKEFLSSLPAPDSHLPVSTGYGCATLFWMAQNKPEILEKYDRAATIQDFVVAILCDLDAPVMAVQNAASWGYFNTETRSWNKEILEKAGFPTKFLPKVESDGQYVGRCSQPPWPIFPENVPVGAAMGDFQCCVISTLKESLQNQVMLNISTSIQLAFIMPEGFRPLNDNNNTSNHSSIENGEECHVQYYPYFGGRYVAVAAAVTGGNSLQAFVNMLQQWIGILGCSVPQAKIWEKLLSVSENEEITSSTLEIIPTIFGERHAPDQSASVSNIDLGQISLGQVFRALCRGIIENLHKMMPKSMLTKAGIQSVVGSGTALSKNPILQQEFQRIYQLETNYGAGGDASFGAALAVLKNLKLSK